MKTDSLSLYGNFEKFPRTSEKRLKIDLKNCTDLANKYLVPD